MRTLTLLAFILSFATTSATAQVAPALLLPAADANVSEGDVEFSWTTIPGTTTYRLMVKDQDGNPVAGVPASVWTDSTSYTHNLPALADGSYQWRVRANAPTVGSFSEWRTLFVTTSGGSSVPTNTLPENGSTHTAGIINFSWTSVAGAATYRIDIKRTSGELIANAWPSTNSFNQSLSDGEYQWRVRVNSPQQGDFTPWNVFSVDDVSSQPPSLLQPSAGSTVSSGSISFSWEAVSGAVDYRIDIDEGQMSGGTMIWSDRNLSTRTGTSTTINGFVEGDYRWRMKSRFGGTPSDSEWGPWVEFSVTNSSPPTAINTITPNSSTGDTPASTFVPFSWSGGFGAASYYIEVVRILDGQSMDRTISGSAQSYDWPLVDFEFGYSYQWRIRATNSAGSFQSGWKQFSVSSEAVTVVPGGSNFLWYGREPTCAPPNSGANQEHYAFFGLIKQLGGWHSPQCCEGGTGDSPEQARTVIEQTMNGLYQQSGMRTLRLGLVYDNNPANNNKKNAKVTLEFEDVPISKGGVIETRIKYYHDAISDVLLMAHNAGFTNVEFALFGNGNSDPESIWPICGSNPACPERAQLIEEKQLVIADVYRLLESSGLAFYLDLQNEGIPRTVPFGNANYDRLEFKKAFWAEIWAWFSNNYETSTGTISIALGGGTDFVMPGKIESLPDVFGNDWPSVLAVHAYYRFGVEKAENQILLEVASLIDAVEPAGPAIPLIIGETSFDNGITANNLRQGIIDIGSGIHGKPRDVLWVTQWPNARESEIDGSQPCKTVTFAPPSSYQYMKASGL